MRELNIRVLDVQVKIQESSSLLGLRYQLPQLHITLLKLMQNLDISADVCDPLSGRGRGERFIVIMKPRGILRAVTRAERLGLRFDAGTLLTGSLIGLDAL